MSIGEVHVGDIGTIFRHTVYDQDGDIVDISTADPIKIIFNKPDGTALVKTAELTGDGTDGQMEYTTITADLSVAGTLIFSDFWCLLIWQRVNNDR